MCRPDGARFWRMDGCVETLLTDHPNVDLNALGMPADWMNQPLWQNNYEQIMRL